MRQLTRCFIAALTFAALAAILEPRAMAEDGPTVAIDPDWAGFAAISVRDFEASTNWYIRHFGLKKGFTYRSDDGSVQIAVLSRDRLTIEIQQHVAAQAAPAPGNKAFLRHGIFKFGVGVQDVRTAVARLEAAGVSVLVKPFDDQDGRYASAVVTDNSGLGVQLFQRIKASPAAPLGHSTQPGDSDSLNLVLPLDRGERIPVGTLRREADDFVFEYSAEFVKSGLPLLPDFPKTGEVYRSPELWPFFLVRLPPVDRPDVRAEIERMNLQADDTLQILGRLGRAAITSPYELTPAGA